MNTLITTPVLLIGFKRPDVIAKTLDYIRKVKPEKLYVAVDAARQNKPGEETLVNEVKDIVKNIDWKCETHYRFNEKNKGGSVTISEAISWVLENEETVIVIEDDIVAPSSFFQFAQEMLEKYKDEEQIYMISSNQVTPIEMPNNEDYLFAIYGHIWGWATWRRAWKNFDLYINDFDEILESGVIDKLTQSKAERKSKKRDIKLMKKRGKGNNTWATTWAYIRFKNAALSIIPRVHLSSNIGVDGWHTKGETSAHFRPFDEEFVAKRHPDRVIHNKEYDDYHFRTYLNVYPSIMSRAFNKALRILKLK